MMAVRPAAPPGMGLQPSGPSSTHGAMSGLVRSLGSSVKSYRRSHQTLLIP